MLKQYFVQIKPVKVKKLFEKRMNQNVVIMRYDGHNVYSLSEMTCKSINVAHN